LSLRTDLVYTTGNFLPFGISCATRSHQLFSTNNNRKFRFLNLITLPNNQQAFVPKTKIKIQPTITIIHIYSTKQTSKNTKMGKIPWNVPT